MVVAKEELTVFERDDDEEDEDARTPAGDP